jgi:glycosyltransferase involved in cell wall biosynthesis
MDVFISLSKAEVFPLSIAEAQSCGLPVICLNSGGMPEMIQQSINGFVVTQPSDLLHVLGQFIRPETNRKKMQVSARRHALANYSTNVVIKQYIDIYSALISD